MKPAKGSGPERKSPASFGEHGAGRIENKVLKEWRILILWARAMCLLCLIGNTGLAGYLAWLAWRVAP